MTAFQDTNLMLELTMHLKLTSLVTKKKKRLQLEFTHTDQSEKRYHSKKCPSPKICHPECHAFCKRREHFFCTAKLQRTSDFLSPRPSGNLVIFYPNYISTSFI